MSHNHNRDYTKYHNDPQTSTPPIEEKEPAATIVQPAPVVDDQEVEMPIGVVIDCQLLNVRKMPSPTAEVVCTIKCGEQVAIDKSESTDLFYKVYAEIGAEGYCMKQYIEIES